MSTDLTLTDPPEGLDAPVLKTLSKRAELDIECQDEAQMKLSAQAPVGSSRAQRGATLSRERPNDTQQRQRFHLSSFNARLLDEDKRRVYSQEERFRRNRHNTVRQDGRQAKPIARPLCRTSKSEPVLSFVDELKVKGKPQSWLSDCEMP